ncbi:hypothetical protein [Rubellimicrobium arenae]|uniref:hypothetical protein n=1 Tax=Rubellimicrobium arenae TaxID=2817372 RepID=UPI001B311FF9|nr:hypothetical protein [Rubellimicrobium arenae]
MLNLATERATLAKAERDIAEGEARIANQADLVGRLRATGQDIGMAEALLATLQGTLRQWQDHRDEILRTIARLEQESAPAGEEPGPGTTGGTQPL